MVIFFVLHAHEISHSTKKDIPNRSCFLCFFPKCNWMFCTAFWNNMNCLLS